MKPIGYFVLESCEDYEQVLGLRVDDKTPPEGVLTWTAGPRALFQDRASAKAAIDRTEHYRLAFGGIGHPEKRFCKIAAVANVPTTKPAKEK